MALDKDELLKLSPQARLKKLKELEEQRKKEIEEAEKLLKETEIEVFSEAVKSDRPPENIHKIAGHNLEEAVDAEHVPEIKEGNFPHHNPLDDALDLYNKVKAYAAKDEPLSGEEARTVGYLYDVFNEVVHKMSENDDKLDRVTSKMKRMVSEIMGEYQANVKYDSE